MRRFAARFAFASGLLLCLGSFGWSAPKPEEPKPQVPKLEEPKLEVPKLEEPKLEEPKLEVPKLEVPKLEVPKLEVPKLEVPKLEEPKLEVPKLEVPKLEVPKLEVPKLEVPKLEVPKLEVPKLDVPERLRASERWASPASGLRVQRRWRLLAVELDTLERLRLAPYLPRYTRAIERELPGLEVAFANERRLRYRLGADEAKRLRALRPERRDRAVTLAGLRLAEEAGVSIADYDVVFVFSPLVSDRLFGLSHVERRDAKGRRVRGGLINTRPLRVLGRSLARRGVPLPSGSRRGGGKEGQGASSKQLGEQLGKALEALGRLPRVRELLMAPTLAHEFGHFLAPGDLNVRDGYQAPWLPHGTGPSAAENPAGHGLDCCMYKGRDLRLMVRKVLVMRGRLVRFCDACRERIGCKKGKGS